MPAKKIEVDPTELGAGADSCTYAADSARKGAEHLGRATVASGIFGDFAEAHQFHRGLGAAHQRHQEGLADHHTTLTALSGKATTAQRAFTGTDESEADAFNSAAGEFG